MTPLTSKRGDAVMVTGAAGFIGRAVCERLLHDGRAVIGVDNINDYYDPALKLARLKTLEQHEAFRFARIDIADAAAFSSIFRDAQPESVVHLAAQPGVRYSLQNPRAYVDSNIVAFLNTLEACRAGNVRHLVYASSSSVYGGNLKTPFSVSDPVDHPVSLYAATKKANELMAHSYAHLFRIPVTGLRFFTVYGPWGRPDMAPFLFTKAILEGRPIDVYNHGLMKRDFTYIDDIVEGVVRILGRPAAPAPEYDPHAPDASKSNAPYRVYNIGNCEPVELLTFIETLEDVLGRKVAKRMLPLQPGDVISTEADVSDLERDIGFKPKTSLRAGLESLVDWYRCYHESRT